MSTVVNLGSKTAAVVRKGLSWLGIALLVSLGLLGPRAVPLGQVALWYVTGGPPLDFDAPHDGQVIAHIDVLGRIPPDISRIRITNTADGTGGDTQSDASAPRDARAVTAGEPRCPPADRRVSSASPAPESGCRRLCRTGSRQRMAADRTASRTARIRTPRCRCGHRAVFRGPAPGSCRRPYRESFPLMFRDC